jgi:aminoglycoside phosphotransferase (APT) family kinase protein
VAEAGAAELSPALRAWVEKAAGVSVVASRRLPGGGSRHTILVDAERPDGAPLGLVLRLEGGGSHSGTSFSLEREYHAYRALEGRAAPVPRAYGLMPDGSALLMERLEGTSDFQALPAEQRAAVAERFMEALGRLHAIDAGELELPGFERPRTAREHATIDLGRWEALARESCWHEPLVRYAFSRLAATAPRQVQRTVLVQGDTGPGNFMATPERITGLIDWEFCHVGDPMDDLGWLHSRARGLIGAFEVAYPRYESTSGLKVDPVTVAYYHRMATLRCAVTVALGIRKGGALGVIPYRHAFRTYLARLADLLVEAAGIAVERDQLTPAAGSTSPLFSEARAELRNHVLAHEGLGFRAGAAAQAALIALTALELRERFGLDVEARDEEDRRAYLGAGGGLNLAEEADAAGARGDPAMLAFLARRIWRERAMWPR